MPPPDDRNGHTISLAPSGPGWYPSSGALVANQVWLCRWMPTISRTVTAVGFGVITAAAANDNVTVGIINSAGTTVLASSSSTAGKLNATGIKSVPLTAPLAVVAGTVYFAALVCPSFGGAAPVLVKCETGDPLATQIQGSGFSNQLLARDTSGAGMTAPFTMNSVGASYLLTVND